MAEGKLHYNVEEYIKQKRQQGISSRIPPRQNLLAAADHIRNLFDSKKFLYAVMGGLEMVCLGFRRHLSDLQIAYEDKDFIHIKMKLEKDKRVCLPVGMNPLFPTKILIRTGPTFKDAGCATAAMVEVDLIPPGSLGTPPNKMLSTSILLLNMKNGANPTTYKGLNMFYLVNTLLHQCKVRDLVWDPRNDIMFLCQNYGEQVQAIRTQLNQSVVQDNFLGTRFFSQLSTGEQSKCCQILQGRKPQPVMAVISPTKEDDHRTSCSTSEVPKQQICAQRTHEATVPNGLPALLMTPFAGKPKTIQRHSTDGNHGASTTSRSFPASLTPGTSSRNSPSRYRPISAPISHYPSRQGPQSTHGEHPLVISTQQSVQHFTTPLNTHPLKSHPVKQFSGSDMQTQTFPAAISTTSAPRDLGQQCWKPQRSLEAKPNPTHDKVQQHPITQEFIPPKPKSAQQGPQYAGTGRSLPVLQTGSSYTIFPEDTLISGLELSPTVNHPARGVDPVGSAEPYQTPQPYFAKTRHNDAGTNPDSTHSVFELDATPQRSTSLTKPTPDIQHATPVHQIPEAARTPEETTHEAPIHKSPSLLPNPLDTPSIPRPPPENPHSPSPSRVSSPPPFALPASLTPGHAKAHHALRPSKSSTPSTPKQTISHAAAPSPPPSAHAFSSPDMTPAPLSVYKAYQPPVRVSLPSAGAVRKSAARAPIARDARTLAREYQAELCGFEDGYGRLGRVGGV